MYYQNIIELPFMTDTSSLSQDLIDIMQNLKNLRLEYQVLYSLEENSVEIESFANPRDAFDFYISVADEQNPILKCLITASMGNFFYSCIAPLTLKSLNDIVEANNSIPRHIDETARKALAKRILNDLPFNSDAHGCII
jgi:hypothetical protein